MVTIRTIENIKLGARITLLNGIYAFLIGLFYVIMNNFILVRDFRAIDDFWRFFVKYNSKIGDMMIRDTILMGIIFLCLGICIIAFSYHILKKKEKITWVVLFIIGILFWSSYSLIEIYSQNIYIIAIAFIGWISFVIGMIIPIRYYIEKVEQDY